jgi:hypothetical protein
MRKQTTSTSFSDPTFVPTPQTAPAFASPPFTSFESRARTASSAFRMLESNIESSIAADSKVGPQQKALLPIPSGGEGLAPVQYNDSWFGKMVTKFLAHKIAEIAGKVPQVAGDRGTNKEFGMLVDAAFLLNARPGQQAQEMTSRLLKESLPSWFPSTFRAFLGCFPTWFDARHAAVSTVLITNWLVGPSKIVDTPVEMLDSEEKIGRGAGWGNEPTGWVPGFALGGKWRKELGAGQGVEIERCRVLEQSQCLSVCLNVCKGPTQKFFTGAETLYNRLLLPCARAAAAAALYTAEFPHTIPSALKPTYVQKPSQKLSGCHSPWSQTIAETVGLPLTMVPDFETTSCTLHFGATPPPLAEDPAAQFACLTKCPVASGGRGDCDAAEGDRCSKLASA